MAGPDGHADPEGGFISPQYGCQHLPAGYIRHLLRQGQRCWNNDTARMNDRCAVQVIGFKHVAERAANQSVARGIAAGNCLGFVGHPGAKAGMVEDLIMEFDETPEDPGPALELLRDRQREIEDALVSIMTGLVQVTGLMRP